MKIITTKNGGFAINGTKVISFVKDQEIILDQKNAKRMIELGLAYDEKASNIDDKEQTKMNDEVIENKMNNEVIDNKDTMKRRGRPKKEG